MARNYGQQRWESRERESSLRYSVRQFICGRGNREDWNWIKSCCIGDDMQSIIFRVIRDDPLGLGLKRGEYPSQEDIAEAVRIWSEQAISFARCNDDYCTDQYQRTWRPGKSVDRPRH